MHLHMLLTLMQELLRLNPIKAMQKAVERRQLIGHAALDVSMLLPLLSSADKSVADTSKEGSAVTVTLPLWPDEVRGRQGMSFVCVSSTVCYEA